MTAGAKRLRPRAGRWGKQPEGWTQPAEQDGNHIGGSKDPLSATVQEDVATFALKILHVSEYSQNGATIFGNEQSLCDLRAFRKIRGLRDCIAISCQRYHF